MKQYKAYLFDFDGTLVDSFESLVYVFTESYKCVGVNIDKSIVRHLMRVPLATGYYELNAPIEKGDEFAEAIVKYLKEPKTLNLTEIYPDTIKFLNTLKSHGKVLGIVTSNNSKHVIDVLNKLNIDPNIFSIIIGNGECEVHKPNPDPAIAALEALNIKAEDACLIGDALDDMKCAESAGIDQILIDRLDEYSDSKYLTIKSFDEIKL